MSTEPADSSLFRLDEAAASALAQEFGTPLYVVDEATFRRTIREYRAAFSAVAPGSRLTYASKANSTLALLAIAHEEGCAIDVASEGELRAAMLARVPPGDCHVHGNNKSRSFLQFAFSQGVNEIVVDNAFELEMIAELAKSAQCPLLLLRLAPGVNAQTNEKISTGHKDSKFGFGIADRAADAAVAKCLALELPLIGFHCHVGSQLLHPEAQIEAAEVVTTFAIEMQRKYSFSATVLNFGGGRGIECEAGKQPIPIQDYCRILVDRANQLLGGTGLTPTFVQEPGRSLIGGAGVTLYTVGARKTQGNVDFIFVDGGLSDNPRPIMYGGTNIVTLTRNSNAPSKPMTIAGAHCETDTLFSNVECPDDVQPGDLLQVLGTGAYNASMASNYNRFPRPAMVLLREGGQTEVIQTRETWEQMFARDVGGTE